MKFDTKSVKFKPEAIPDRNDPKFISFYLPQFHRIPENDAWWGEGFTEWTNVRKAKPLFRSHNQPRIVGSLGYYDLTNPAAREQQAELAKKSGIDGFCYWHYWFGNGRRILERPLDEVVASGRPDFPFCVCWANQSWTGVWHGAPNRVLMEQTYPGVEDYKCHFQNILPIFRDERYILVNGFPIFLVYSPSDLPNASEFISIWKQMAHNAGLPGLYIVGMSNSYNDPYLQEFDAIMPFGPGDFLNSRPLSPIQKFLRRIAAHPRASFLGDALRYKLNAPIHFQYKDVVEAAFDDLPDDPRLIPCVIPGWDNTPRSGRRGVVFEGATPALFEEYLRKAALRSFLKKNGENLVFIKAWNEWAEGNMLEPTKDDGENYLKAVATVKKEFKHV